MEAHPENIGDLQKARELIERMVFKKNHLQSFELDQLLLKIVASEKNSRPSSNRKEDSGIGKYTFLKVAAVFIVFLIATWVINQLVIKEELETAHVEWKTIQNPKGKKSKVTLPDGSQVNLNYESQLKFPAVFTGEVRRVELVGEAYFDVVHNDSMPFIVTTGQVETEVLGTSFNIRSYAPDENTDISLVTGKVKINLVHEVAGKGTYLSPGEQLRYNESSGQAVKSNFNVEEVTAWKEGIILFKDAGFKEFVDQLERWYGVDFQIYGILPQDWKVNGRYQNEELDDILTGLSFVYGLEYKIQGKNVILNLK